MSEQEFLIAIAELLLIASAAAFLNTLADFLIAPARASSDKAGVKLPGD